ncbi:MAG: penicillin-binding protein 2 [Rhodocyclales bacterium]|nr:penicillin-binding protein 2 [Rhodocyclales bacterium]
MTKTAVNPMLVLAVPVWRQRLMAGLLLVLLAALVVRAAYLQGVQREFLQQQGEARYERQIEVPAMRGRVLDRNGQILADSSPVASIWADPAKVREWPAEDFARLARVLGMSTDELDRRLGLGGRRFVYLRRQLPPDQAQPVAQLGLEGVGVVEEYQRFYPQGEAFAQLVGLVDVDGNGIEGLEASLQGMLQGEAGKRLVIQDRRGRVVQDSVWMQRPRDGRDVVLSLDARIQHLAYRALERVVELHQARAGGAVVIDVRTGEILALANWPSYNPNRRTGLDLSEVRNRVVTDIYEPGSVMKPLLVSLALERGKVKPDTLIDIQGGVFRVGNHTIRDSHTGDRALTVSQVIQKSSNVGVAKIALGLDARDLWHHYRAFGFGVRPDLPLPGVASGRMLPSGSLKPIEVATMAYGHGISASLLQLAHAYQAIANDGVMLPLSLIRRDAPPPVSAQRRLISPQTAQDVKAMMELVTQAGGTATRAAVGGYRTAGKTGTAHKLENGRYVDKYVASFVGYAPASQPRLVVAVMIDEPKAKSYYGGIVAAPVFAEIVGQVLPGLGVAPDMPPAVAAAERPRG